MPLKAFDHFLYTMVDKLEVNFCAFVDLFNIGFMTEIELST